MRKESDLRHVLRPSGDGPDWAFCLATVLGELRGVPLGDALRVRFPANPSTSDRRHNQSNVFRPRYPFAERAVFAVSGDILPRPRSGLGDLMIDNSRIQFDQLPIGQHG